MRPGAGKVRVFSLKLGGFMIQVTHRMSKVLGEGGVSCEVFVFGLNFEVSHAARTAQPERNSHKS